MSFGCKFSQLQYLTEYVIIKITRNSSEDEIANVNFLYDDIVHALQNTIDSCINSARDRRGYVLRHSVYRPIGLLREYRNTN